MGLLSLFFKSPPKLLSLPAGSFTVDREGVVLASTVPSSFPAELCETICREVLEAFQRAGEAQLPLSELTITYPSLRITARELRGGAILFLLPKTPFAPSKKS